MRELHIAFWNLKFYIRKNRTHKTKEDKNSGKKKTNKQRTKRKIRTQQINNPSRRTWAKGDTRASPSKMGSTLSLGLLEGLQKKTKVRTIKKKKKEEEEKKEQN